MRYESINLFPVFVLRISDFLESYECDIIVNKYSNNSSMLKKHDYFTNDAFCSHSNESNVIDDITNMNGFENFKNKINDALFEYSTITGFLPTKVTNSWYNIQKKGSALFDHMHPLSYVSGCLYLNFQEGSNNIFFWNPSQLPLYIPKNSETIYSSETHWITPNKGDLILFPSWIKHGSNGHQNNSDNRITIAFNSLTYQD